MKTVIDRENFRVYVVTPSGAEIEVAKTSDLVSGEGAGEWVSFIHSREPLHFHKTYSKAEAFAALLAHLGLTEHEQTPVDKKTTGLYNKFHVTRTDRSDQPGGKHEGCEYFVLDLTHDPFAIPALRTYADVCAREYPVLSADLIEKVCADRKGENSNG